MSEPVGWESFFEVDLSVRLGGIAHYGYVFVGKGISSWICAFSFKIKAKL